MGGSSSSQLDESKCAYIRGKTEAVISNFSPHYRRQYAVALFHQIRNEVEQHRDPQAHFLKSKPPSDQETVLYAGDILLYAEDLKKWKERYVVIKKDYIVACFENKETYQKGANPKNRILPTGGKVLTSEEEYNAISDKQFPDPIATNEKESAQPFIVVPSQFPVYLWHPYIRHSFFCFPDAESQKSFAAILDDCIRHQNHDFLKQVSLDAQAFSEALQFFRQEKSQYGSWEMITGSQTQILSNLVMEELLPSLQTDLLPKMKGKRNDRKRAWFGTVEETYNLVTTQVSDGFESLQEECKNLAKQLEGTIRSDMDQIVTSKEFVAGKIKATVLEPAEKCCTENIRPFMASILEEIMGPVSSGFSEVRQLFEREINAISQSFQTDNDPVKLKESLAQLENLPLSSVKMEPCYLKVNLLREQLQDLKSRFKFYHIDLVVQRAQNDMQELMENAVYTFNQLLFHASKGDSQKMSTAIEKVKMRVLKQYDYDSSTIRKKIFQDALVLITMPTMQRTLASTCKPELQTFEQFIFADYTNVIQVENVYEEILFGKLLDDTIKVIQEAASLKKHNLFEDSARLASESVSSLTDLKTPSSSAPASPERKQEQVIHKIVDTVVETNEVFIESKSTLSEEVKTGMSPSHIEEPNERKSPEKVLKAESLGKEEPLPKVENIIIAHITDKPESPVLTVEQEDLLHVEQRERKTEEEGPRQEEGPDVAVGNINDIRSLLTVTVEVPPDTSHQDILKVISEGQFVQIGEGEEQADKKESVEERKNTEAAIEQMKKLELDEKQCEVHLEADSSLTTAAVESSIGHLMDTMVTREIHMHDKNEKDMKLCGTSLDVESENSVITEKERDRSQLDKVVDTREVEKEEENTIEVAVGQAIESVQLDSCDTSSRHDRQKEEPVHHESTSKNEDIETVPVQPAANDDSLNEAAEGTNTVDEAFSIYAVGAPDEGPPSVQAMLQEEEPPVQVTCDETSKSLAEVPSDLSKQSCEDASVSLDFSNSAESSTQASTAGTCTEHVAEPNVNE
ncbi:protein Niban 1 isoform X2 [Pleurodeles waltl]|uniref:protein Niban 1 isoform X2 n=1 Tax=Pleurodeles waltl TaxID=8319 RepID=UPI0037099E8C